MSYGAKRYDRPGTPITLKEGAQITDITMRMPRGAVLGGVITDENGQPAFGVTVRVMQVRAAERRAHVRAVGTANVNEMTDDRGCVPVLRTAAGRVRRLGHAAHVRRRSPRHDGRGNPGRHAGAPTTATGGRATGDARFLERGHAATPTPTPKPETETVTVGYASVFYPGTTVAAMASTVTLGQGEERLGVDFPIKLVRTAKLEGTVIVPAGVRPQSGAAHAHAGGTVWLGKRRSGDDDDEPHGAGRRRQVRIHRGASRAVPRSWLARRPGRRGSRHRLPRHLFPPASRWVRR